MTPEKRNTAFKATLSVDNPMGPPVNEVDEGRILETAPIWIPNDWTDECMMPDCSNKFSAILLKKRNHCRYCGKLMCSDCATHTLPHYEPSKRKKQVHVKVCDLCHDKYKAKPLMNLDQLNVLAKKMSEDSRSAKNQSVQLEEEDWNPDSDSDDWGVDAMYSAQPNPGSAPGSAHGTPGQVPNLPFFKAGARAVSLPYEQHNAFDKPLKQSETPVVHATGASGGSLGDDLVNMFSPKHSGNPPFQQSQSDPLSHMMHSQSVMQLHSPQQRGTWHPPHSQQQHGHSLTGFMRQNMNANNGSFASSNNGMMASMASNSSNGMKVNVLPVDDDIFGNLPDVDMPLPGTPSEHKQVNAAFGLVDQMMSANAVGGGGGNQLKHHPQSDSYANAVVLDDNVEVQDLSDSDEYGANFANINLGAIGSGGGGGGNQAVDPPNDIQRQSTNELLSSFMDKKDEPKASSNAAHQQLDHNHDSVKQLAMFGFNQMQIEAAWKMMKAHDKDNSIVPDHGPLFVEKMLDYVQRVQKEVSRNSILGAYKQNDSNSFNAFGGMF